MDNWDYRETWYHGSPLKLTTLLIGSTITQNRDLARIFSHKPEIVCLFDDGQEQRRMHNGTQPGTLYRIAEDIGPDDVYPHPTSAMEPGLEWLTKRELPLASIGPTRIVEEEVLSEEEVVKLREQWAQRKHREASE